MTMRRWFVVALGGIAILLLAGRALSAIYADYQWYEALGAGALWRLRAGTIAAIDAGAFVVTTLFAYANFYAVRHSVVSLVFPRRVGNLEIGEEVPGKYMIAAAAILAILIGMLLLPSGDGWTSAILARSGQLFGEPEPNFRTDLGFFVYWLPFENTLWDWSFVGVAVIGLAVILLYALTPSLRFQRGTLHISGYVRRHLTVLAGILLLLAAWSFRLDMYALRHVGNGPRRTVRIRRRQGRRDRRPRAGTRDARRRGGGHLGRLRRTVSPRRRSRAHDRRARLARARGRAVRRRSRRPRRIPTLARQRLHGHSCRVHQAGLRHRLRGARLVARVPDARRGVAVDSGMGWPVAQPRDRSQSAGRRELGDRLANVSAGNRRQRRQRATDGRVATRTVDGGARSRRRRGRAGRADACRRVRRVGDRRQPARPADRIPRRVADGGRFRFADAHDRRRPRHVPGAPHRRVVASESANLVSGHRSAAPDADHAPGHSRPAASVRAVLLPGTPSRAAAVGRHAVLGRRPLLRVVGLSAQPAGADRHGRIQLFPPRGDGGGSVVDRRSHPRARLVARSGRIHLGAPAAVDVHDVAVPFTGIALARRTAARRPLCASDVVRLVRTGPRHRTSRSAS